ncbi:DNA-protecting protein DprA [Candidatus Berkelbacteria bacterium]|nr:DNA-protecting protein DprA [Candidatus Berkelbacteria bacterium]
MMSTAKQWFLGANLSDVISFTSINFLTPHICQKVYKSFQSFNDFLRANSTELISRGFSQKQTKLLLSRPKNVKKQLELMNKVNIKICSIDSNEYPLLLKEITDPPLWLFYRGDISILNNPTLTIVGTRKPTEYGVNALQNLISDQLASSVVIASGLAYGIDKIAHEISLNNGGKTVGVLAGGLDRIYPEAHQKLAEQIIGSGGVILSEYPPLVLPQAHQFPIRNRILAGLAPLTLVVEAVIKSGTLTTARAAIDYNRDLMAIPGDITRPTSQGPNFLISCGATPLINSEILNSYYKLSAQKIELTELGSAIVEILKTKSANADVLQNLTNSSINEILTELTQLELSGLVALTSNGDYTLKQSV